MYVQHQQTLQAEFVEGVLKHLITNINIDLGEDATLHVPLNMTVGGTKLYLHGKVTFNNLILEDGGEAVLHATSYTASYANGAYTQTSNKGAYTLGYLGNDNSSFDSQQ